MLLRYSLRLLFRIRYRFTWPTSSETADKIRIQLLQERRPASYDQEQEKDEAIELLSDQDFSIASLSVESQTDTNAINGRLNDNTETDESSGSDDEGIDWLNEPSESTRGAVFTTVSSNSMGNSEVDCRDRGASADRKELVADEEEECQPAIVRRPGSNLAALGNLRAKLSTAVHRQGSEQSDRILATKTRATALEYLRNDLSSVSPASPEKEGERTGQPKESQSPQGNMEDAAGKPRESIPCRANAVDKESDAVDKESDAVHDTPDSEEKPVEVASSDTSSVQKNVPTKQTTNSRLLPPFLPSTKSDEGSLGDQTASAGTEGTLPRMQPASEVRDIVSFRKTFRPKGAGNMREFRITPGQPGWQSLEKRARNQPEAVSDSTIRDETTGTLSSLPRSLHSGEPSHPSPAKARSQPEHKNDAAETSQTILPHRRSEPQRVLDAERTLRSIPEKRMSQPHRSLGSTEGSHPGTATRESQPHPRASPKSNVGFRESEKAESPSPLLLKERSHEGQSPHRRYQSRYPRHEVQGPVSMRRRIFNVLSKGRTESSRKTERNLQSPSAVPSSPLTPASNARKRTIFPFAIE